MKIRLISIGRTDEDYLIQGINKYLQRLQHYASFEYVAINDIKNGGKLPLSKLKDEEGKLILQQVRNDYMVLLDEGGRTFSSVEFSEYLQKKMNTLAGTITFVIGGPYGFSDEVYQSAHEKMSLSKMTFSHQMIRLFFVEQLYRAFTIIKGEKYHHL